MNLRMRWSRLLAGHSPKGNIVSHGRGFCRTASAELKRHTACIVEQLLRCRPVCIAVRVFHQCPTAGKETEPCHLIGCISAPAFHLSEEYPERLRTEIFAVSSRFTNLNEDDVVASTRCSAAFTEPTRYANSRLSLEIIQYKRS